MIPSPAPGPTESRRGPALALAAVLAATLLAYVPALSGTFVFDDYEYITENPLLRDGLTGGAFVRAFTSLWASNWHPVTWLSHLLDVEIFGVSPGGPHVVNLLLHLANAALLFFLLTRLTGARWRSLLAAALFALHPLNVESVAWISERKNVLSMLFALLAFLAWEGYARRGGPLRYAAALALFAVGLAAKPMLVTLPALLLLLDFWPLARLRRGPVALVLEKLPFFALSAASSVVTAAAQRGVMGTLDLFPLWSRAANALLSYGLYLLRTFLPVGLSPIYPHPGRAIPWAATALAALSLVAIGAAAWWLRRTRPSLAVGYLWFLGAMVPVLGLVQVGAQAMADRYAYLPHVGLFIALAWLPGAIPPARRWAAAGLAAAALAALGILTASYSRTWRDEFSFYGRAIAMTRDNYLSHYGLGLAFGAAGRGTESIEHLERATEIFPGYQEAWVALGRALGRAGRKDDAVFALHRVTEADRPKPKVLNNAAFALCELGLWYEATFAFRKTIDMEPELAEAHLNLGIALTSLKKWEEAVGPLRRAVELAPTAVAESSLGYALENSGRREEALEHYRRSILLDPSPHNLARGGIQRIFDGR